MSRDEDKSMGGLILLEIIMEGHTLEHIDSNFNGQAKVSKISLKQTGPTGFHPPTFRLIWVSLKVFFKSSLFQNWPSDPQIPISILPS